MSNVQRLDRLAAAAGAAGALDLNKLKEVEDLLGEAATGRMLDRLAGDVASRLTDAALQSGRLEVASIVHALASATGLLGFSGLSGACAALERACRQDLPTDAATADLKSERDRALSLLSARSSAAAA